MPHWGRPPGAMSRREYYERARQWEESRFQEVDSDDDEGHGVGLGADFGEEVFLSDDLRFTGADMGHRPLNGRSFPYEEYRDSSEEESSEDDEQYAMQVALRDKEELLAQKAMDRIRRAQEKGKPSVDLTQSELDALQRRRDKKGSTDKKKRKGSGSSGSSADRKRKEKSRSVPSRQISSEEVSLKSSRRRKHVQREGSGSPQLSTAVPPGFVVAGPGGVPTFSPLGYYAPPVDQIPSPTHSHRSSRRSSRRPSLSSYVQQQQAPPPPPQYQHQYQQTRYFSLPEATPGSPRHPASAPRTPPTRPALPHEPGWTPRSRSSSSVRQPLPPMPYPPIDPFQYQTYSPPVPPGGQPAVQYAQYGGSLRRAPGTGSYPGSSGLRETTRASSPTPVKRQTQESSSSSEESSSEEEVEGSSVGGVRVNVIPGQWSSDLSAREPEPRRRDRR